MQLGEERRCGASLPRSEAVMNESESYFGAVQALRAPPFFPFNTNPICSKSSAATEEKKGRI